MSVQRDERDLRLFIQGGIHFQSPAVNGLLVEAIQQFSAYVFDETGSIGFPPVLRIGDSQRLLSVSP